MQKKLGLNNHKAFKALVTDIYVNASQEIDGKVSCLLLQRIGSLLSQLAGNKADKETAVNELLQTYETGKISADK